RRRTARVRPLAARGLQGPGAGRRPERVAQGDHGEGAAEGAEGDGGGGVDARTVAVPCQPSHRTATVRERIGWTNSSVASQKFPDRLLTRAAPKQSRDRKGADWGGPTLVG